MENGESVFIEIYPALRRFAAAISRPDVDPDDLVQEVLVRTLKRRSISDLEDPVSYLRQAVLNLVRNQHRDAARRRAILRRNRTDEMITDAYPSESIDLSGLTVEQRAVVFLQFVEQRTTAEIAELLDLSPEAVRSRSSRAIQALRLELVDRSTE